jgi:alpha-amylase
MSGKRLLLGLYDQKPLGTRREDLEYSLHACYKPLLTFLYANPEIRISLYFSGIIYQWLENEHPEINMLISDMVKRRQIELLSGGFYDPVLSMLPTKDRSHQVEMLTTFIRKRFGSRPRTAWITDQIWSPALVNTLSISGIRAAFQHTNSQIAHPEPFLMQEMGKLLCLFPIHDGLTGQIHAGDFNGFQSSLDAAQKTHMHSVISIMIDMGKLVSQSMLDEVQTCEKLSHTLVQIGSQQDKFSLTLPHREYQQVTGEDYLPSGWYSYSKPDTADHINELLLIHPEIKYLYGKLHYSSKLIPGIKKEKGLKKLALKEMLKGESFGPFSTSSNGGMYQHALRKENYSHLIEVDKISREKGVFTSSITTYDIDFDTEDEYIYRGKNITAVLDRIGGQVIELDYLVNSWNYLDTFVGRDEDLARRSIPTITPGRKQLAFTDLMFLSEPDLLRYDKYDEQQVINLESFPYTVSDLNRDRREITFTADICLDNHNVRKLRLTKFFTCRTNSIMVNYRFENISGSRISWQFGSEYNLSFSSDSEDEVSYRCIDAKHERKLGGAGKSLAHVKLLKIGDTAKKAIVSLYADRRFTVSKRHYTTTMITDLGEEEIYQFTRLLALWYVELDAGETWETQAAVRIEKMK